MNISNKAFFYLTGNKYMNISKTFLLPDNLAFLPDT